MRQSPVMNLLTSSLTLVTVVTVLALGWTLASPAIADPGPIAMEQVVRSFYTAVNETIRTGNTSPLNAVVAEHMVVHGSLATLAPDRDGLTRYLASLHAVTPSLTLDVTEVASTGNRAVVDVTIHGAVGMFLGSPIAETASPGTVDAFRISDHQILEYWSSTANPLMLEPLAQSPAVAGAGARNLALERLTIPPGSSFIADGGDEYRWLYGEVGKVFVRTGRTRPGPMRSPTTWPEPDLSETQLAAKELLGLPIWSRTAIDNLGAAPASVLVFEVEPLASRSSRQAGDEQPSIDGRPALRVWWTGMNQAKDSEATATTLTGRILTTIPARQSVVDVGEATLAQGPVMTIPDAADRC